MEQYLQELRKASHGSLSDAAIQALTRRRDSTNASVDATDVGRASRSRHPAARRVADEFGLRRKQRLAFHTFASDLLSRRGDEPPSSADDALRLYIGGGVGTGKSHVLKAIKALIECPAVVGPRSNNDGAPASRLLTVAASRGRRADGIGGVGGVGGVGGGGIKTIRSVCDVTPSSGDDDGGDGDGDGAGGGVLPSGFCHGGQRPLPAKKVARWEGVTVLAIEEISLVSCDMMVALHRAACSVHPQRAGLPFAGLTVIFLGDFDQLKPEGSNSLATPRAELNPIEQAGAEFFRSVNKAVVLDGGLSRFSDDYATVMRRILIGECSNEDVDFLNCRKLDGLNLGVTQCWDAQYITFRDSVSQALMVPVMREWCHAVDTPLFLSTASDVLVGDQRAGQAKKVPDPKAPWPPGLRDGVRQLEVPKTSKLPQISCLAIGAKVVVGKHPQYPKLGVTNNADAEITDIEFDPREPYLRDMRTGYHVVELQFPPTRVLVHIEAADKAGLHLEGLPRGVIGCCPLERDFSIVGRYERKFTIHRTQLPLVSGSVMSVYRAQGETFAKIVLDLRKPVGGALNSRAAVHAALSRAADVDEVYLLTRVSLDDLTNRQDAGVVAHKDHLKRLEETTLATFLADTSIYRPTTTTSEEEPFISPTCQDDLANQRNAGVAVQAGLANQGDADAAVEVDDLERLEKSETDSIADDDGSTSWPTTAGSPDSLAEQLEHEANVAATIDYFKRLEEATLKNFLEDPTTFRPARVDPPTTARSQASRGGTTSGNASGSSS